MLGRLEEHTVDFIVSDRNMPKRTGLALLKAVCAEARKDNIVEAARAGADGCIVKPYTSTVLGEKIKTILKRRNPA